MSERTNPETAEYMTEWLLNFGYRVTLEWVQKERDRLLDRLLDPKEQPKRWAIWVHC